MDIRTLKDSEGAVFSPKVSSDSVYMSGSKDTLTSKLNNVDTAVDEKLNTTALLDKVYPVGSIYMSVNDVSPASFLGGTWESLQDRFLVGAGNSYAVNATGGSSSHAHTTGGHVLTANELPYHTHGEAGGHDHTRGSMDITGSIKYPILAGESGSGAFADSYSTGTKYPSSASQNTRSWVVDFKASKGWNNGTTSWKGAHTHDHVGENWSHSHGDTGSSSSLPPYLAVYMWKRTA